MDEAFVVGGEAVGFGLDGVGDLRALFFCGGAEVGVETKLGKKLHGVEAGPDSRIGGGGGMNPPENVAGLCGNSRGDVPGEEERFPILEVRAEEFHGDKGGFEVVEEKGGDCGWVDLCGGLEVEKFVAQAGRIGEPLGPDPELGHAPFNDEGAKTGIHPPDLAGDASHHGSKSEGLFGQSAVEEEGMEFLAKIGRLVHGWGMRRILLVVGLAGFVFGGEAEGALAREKVFVNPGKFEKLVERGVREGWAGLPLGDRTARVGMALVGTPYVNYTLELHDRIETPCVNMDGMDCWTFFEIALATARAFDGAARPTQDQMLRLIELDRYRGGKCDGTFTSRLHHLEDWSRDNEKRGLIRDVTPDLPGARKLHREMKYMGEKWKSFRQLKANPRLVPMMARIEAELSRRGIYYIPKEKVAGVEKLLRNGDVISIVTTWPGTYTSHVGLAVRDGKGVLRFLHASRNYRKVVLDERLSTYLKNNSKHMGIMVARPNPVK